MKTKVQTNELKEKSYEYYSFQDEKLFFKLICHVMIVKLTSSL